MEKAYIILCEGSTNLSIARELFSLDIPCQSFTSGMILGGVLCNSAREVRGRFPLVAYRGKLVDTPYEKALEDFHKETVIIKGANAIDSDGFVGVIVSGYGGGSIAKVIGTSVSQGLRIVCPVGLEKTVFSVPKAARHSGGKLFDYSMGADIGIFVLAHADVVTEINAVHILSGADAVHLASGGIGGSEGSVVLCIEGERNDVTKAVAIVEGVKGAPPLDGKRMKCTKCKYVNCAFYNMSDESLPAWMRRD